MNELLKNMGILVIMITEVLPKIVEPKQMLPKSERNKVQYNIKGKKIYGAH